MKKKSSTKKPLVSKADLDKINNAVDHTVTMHAKYEDVFYEKIRALAKQISDMVTDDVNTDSEAARRAHGRSITRMLNEMYKLFVKHEDDINVLLRETDEGSAVIALLQFADKVGMIRLLHVPKLVKKEGFIRKSSENIISFRVYIAHMRICWCRIRTTKRKNGIVVLTRFTN